MILVVTGIGFLIHVYATGYMDHDNGFYRFFGYFNLFIFFMLMLVLANNYGLLFVGWEGVGLCSYLLIGFYFQKKSAGDAGKKAFIVNRVGDAGFVLGMLLMLSRAGHAAIHGRELAPAQRTVPSGGRGFRRPQRDRAAACSSARPGKSAQFPLYVWLPDAMEGPTPVSALIHAATMVTAGVYMVARSAALFQLTPHTSNIVAAIGAFTAILAASIALVQNDIKRVLAYSTVSQLGYMFLALGVGAYWVAVFHLFTHAFFKALLFLCSGSVIHAMGGEQDMRNMGGLKNKIPITHWTMWVGSVAIAGIPGLAGFFSKDEILWQTYSSPLGRNDPVRGGAGDCRDDGLLHVAADESDVLRQVAREARGGGAHSRVARVDDRAADRCWPSVACWLAGSGHPSCGISASSSARSRVWLEPAFASAVAEAAHEGEQSGHRMDADGRLGGDRDPRDHGGAVLLPSPAGDSGFDGEVAQAAARAALQQVVRGRGLRLPLRERSGQEAAADCSGPSTATWWTAA